MNFFSNYRFTLDIQKGKSQASIPVHYGDTGNRFYITLTDGGNPYIIPDGCRVDLYMKKPNSNLPLVNACIIENNSIVRYEFNKNTASVEGMHKCELRLYSPEGRLITTPSFVMVVDQRVVYDDEIGTEDQFQKIIALDVIAREEERVAAEGVRVENETARIEAETERLEAEEARKEAEEKRVARTDDHDQRLKYMEEYINDDLTTEDSLAYRVDVPAESRETAKILSVGGMTYKSKNIADISKGVNANLVDNGDGTFTFTKRGDTRFSAKIPIFIPANKAFCMSANIIENTSLSSNAIQLRFTNSEGDAGYGTLTEGGMAATLQKNATSVQLYMQHTDADGAYIKFSEFQIEFGSKKTGYEPYFEGLRNAAVEKVRSEGVNKFDISQVTYAEYASGVTGSLYGYIENGELVARYGLYAGGVFWKPFTMHLKSGEYTVSADCYVPTGGAPTRTVYLGLRGTSTNSKFFNVSSFDKWERGSVKISVTKEEDYVLLAQGSGNENFNHGMEVRFKNISVTSNGTTEFTPFVGNTFAIPQSVQELDGYGVGVLSERDNAFYYNTVDFSGKFSAVCKKITLNGSEDWGMVSNYFTLTVGAYGDIIPYACIAEKYEIVAVAQGADIGIGITNSNTYHDARIQFRPEGGLLSIDALKAFLAENPIEFVYTLTTPEVTDISSLLPSNNAIEVEGNGTLTFVNEYGYAVPSSIEWRLESSHRVAFEHSQTKGNPHETTAAEVGAYTTEQIDEKLAGYAPLVGGQIPSSYLPSYVDDVLEYDTFDAFPIEGESGKIYVDKNKNKSYRWSGSQYVELTSSGLVLGETFETAFRGDRGKAAYDHSQITEGNPHGTTLEDMLPVTEEDNGKILQVVEGSWSAVAIPNAEGGSF